MVNLKSSKRHKEVKLFPVAQNPSIQSFYYTYCLQGFYEYFFRLVLAMLVLVDHQKETIFINAVAVKSNSITCRQYHGVLLGCILRAATSF